MVGHVDLGGVGVGTLERLTVRAEERAAGGEGETGHPGRGRAYNSPRKARCWREVKRVSSTALLRIAVSPEASISFRAFENAR